MGAWISDVLYHGRVNSHSVGYSDCDVFGSHHSRSKIVMTDEPPVKSDADKESNMDFYQIVAIVLFTPFLAALKYINFFIQINIDSIKFNKYGE